MTQRALLNHWAHLGSAASVFRVNPEAGATNGGVSLLSRVYLYRDFITNFFKSESLKLLNVIKNDYAFFKIMFLINT